MDTKAIAAFCREYPNYYFCLVDDGSRDQTYPLLNKLAQNSENRIRAITQENKGKAEAVRTGMLAAAEWEDFATISFMDADFATPLVEMQRLIQLSQEKYLLVMGSRIKRLGAVVERSAYRHYLGRIFATLASFLLGLAVYDTQCGAKVFRASLVPALFKEPFQSKWLFDIELLFRLMQVLGEEKARLSVLEVPVEAWIHQKNSKVSFLYMLQVPFDLLKIYLVYRAKKTQLLNQDEEIPSNSDQRNGR